MPTANTATLDAILGVGTQVSLGYAATAGFSEQLVSVTVPSTLAGYQPGMSLQIGDSNILLPIIMAGAGDTPLNPLITPTNPNNPVYEFLNPQSGHWYDPPFVDGYQYELDGNGMFNSFTTYIGEDVGPLDVIINGQILGEVNPGDTFDFLTPVSSFELLGIDPPLDEATTDVGSAYPVELDFSGSPDSLLITPEQTAAPEPSSLAMASVAVGLGLFAARRMNVTR